MQKKRIASFSPQKQTTIFLRQVSLSYTYGCYQMSKLSFLRKYKVSFYFRKSDLIWMTLWVHKVSLTKLCFTWQKKVNVRVLCGICFFRVYECAFVQVNVRVCISTRFIKCPDCPFLRKYKVSFYLESRI